MKQLSFFRLALCVRWGASLTLMPGLAFASWVPQTPGTTAIGTSP